MIVLLRSCLNKGLRQTTPQPLIRMVQDLFGGLNRDALFGEVLRSAGMIGQAALGSITSLQL